MSPKREPSYIDEPEHPWERQPGESDSAWTAFVQYRDLGPAQRSLAKLGQIHGKDRRSYSAWSSERSWVARCAAYDAWVDRQTKLAEIEAIREMKRRHVQLGRDLQEAAALGLKRLISAQKALEGTEDPEASSPLNAKGIRELAELGAKLERLSLGEPDAIEVARIETTPTQDYSRLSVDELRTLLTLTRKASSADDGEDTDADADE